MEERDKLSEYFAQIQKIRDEIRKVIVGQDALVRAGLICLLAGEHLLIEGSPGLGKTKFATVLARTVDLKFKRIAGSPELLPKDIVGFPMMVPGSRTWVLKKGSIFTNILLFDEINRATPKTKSALLQPMQERSVSLELIEDTKEGKEIVLKEDVLRLPDPFMVLATMNPVDLEGVYPLLEPEKDRFMMKTKVDYPSFSEEVEIIDRQSIKGETGVASVVDAVTLERMKACVRRIHVDSAIETFAAQIVRKTRPGSENPGMEKFVQMGASPRASMRLVDAARAHAFLDCRMYVLPGDVVSVAEEVLSHRLILATSSKKTAEEIVSQVLDEVRGYAKE